MDGPPRVWLGHMDVPGLAMSRSLCDGVAHTAGVSSEPEFNDYEFNLGREDIILVMASDGLWEFMSNQEVMDIALHTTEPRFAVDRYHFQRNTNFMCIINVSGILYLIVEPIFFSTFRLISEANDRWMREEQVIDDTTVCVAFLGDFMNDISK